MNRGSYHVHFWQNKSEKKERIDTWIEKVITTFQCACGDKQVRSMRV